MRSPVSTLFQESGHSILYRYEYYGHTHLVGGSSPLSGQTLCLHKYYFAVWLRQHFALTMGLPVICLRTARFFPEPPELVALYRLYRGVDVRDAAAAHVLA